jgi:hypothetical protein
MARDAFRLRLQASGLASGKWRRGADPPDFYLRWESHSFAVEVTRVMNVHSLGGPPMSTHGVRAALEGLIRVVENQAQSEGVLSGTYVMFLSPVADLRDHRSAIITSALNYIRTTQGLGVGPEHVLQRRPGGRSLRIRKVGPSGEHIGGWITPEPMKRAHTIRADLTRLCGDVLARKADRLRRIRLPRVLLLIDSYVFGDQADWVDVFQHLSLLEWHTVARIADRSLCYVLHSREPSWR